MQHFYDNIQGWFDFDNIYTAMVTAADDGAHFVEVGAWKGKSSAYMAVEIVNSNKKIQFDCVDVWEGTEPVYNQDYYVQKNQLYEHFIDNMKPVEGFYTPVKKTSIDAAADYQDESLEFVFIDAEHTYNACAADIKAWLPKVKPGGILAGHDYSTSDGVRQAVDELLPGHITDRSSWIFTKN
jgi:hypothetical protein